MTESDWLFNADPEMLFRSGHIELSDRQQYLFAVAVCRRIRGLLIDANSLHSLDVIEAFADGEASPPLSTSRVIAISPVQKGR